MCLHSDECTTHVVECTSIPPPHTPQPRNHCAEPYGLLAKCVTKRLRVSPPPPKTTYTLQEKRTSNAQKFTVLAENSAVLVDFFAVLADFQEMPFRNSPNAPKERFGCKKMHFQ